MPVFANLAIIPSITAEALDNDGLAMPLFTLVWIEGTQVDKILIDCESLVELVSQQLVDQLQHDRHQTYCYTNKGKEISLVDST